jgi:hypothetical protein
MGIIQHPHFSSTGIQEMVVNPPMMMMMIVTETLIGPLM